MTQENTPGSITEKEIINYSIEKKILIDEESISLLKDRLDWKKIINEISDDGSFALNKELVEKKILKTKINLFQPQIEIKEKTFSAHAKEIEPDFRIIEKYDVTNQSFSEGTVANFLNLFRHKFQASSNLLRKRGLKPRKIKHLRQAQQNAEIELIGMVYKKWVTKKGDFAMEIEDEESRCIAWISQKNNKLKESVKRIILDDVIGLRATKISNDMVAVREIFWPDLPQRPTKYAKREVSLAVTSDVHAGSNKFLESQFNNFIDWISGKKGTDKEKKDVSKIKYLIFAGDNVDGIGVYPGQIDELEIKDIYKQYELFEELVLQIPEYIEIFIIPGNHDAVRVADPQPALPKKLVPRLYETKNIHLLGSPSWVEIEGLMTLIYHGNSMHDLFSSVPGLSASKPELGMIELLKRRSLMASYGLRHPYVPEKKDFMNIILKPDLFITGDLHHNGYSNYRGTTCLNAGTWQSITDFQVKKGHVPTPGNVPVLELNTGKIKEHVFYAGENN